MNARTDILGLVHDLPIEQYHAHDALSNTGLYDIAHEMHHHLPTLVVYCLGVLGTAYHLANGLQTATMGWGGAGGAVLLG